MCIQKDYIQEREKDCIADDKISGQGLFGGQRTLQSHHVNQKLQTRSANLCTVFLKTLMSRCYT